jgi:hypothetical protein
MKQHWIARVFGVALVITIFVAGFGSAVHQLWNAVVPAVFGLPALSFGQALGLLCLSTILFGSWRAFPGFPHGGYGGRRLDRAAMTPEQEQALRKGLETGCRRGAHGQAGET